MTDRMRIAENWKKNQISAGPELESTAKEKEGIPKEEISESQ